MRMGKLTYVTLRALEKLNGSQSRRLGELLSAPMDTMSEEAVAEGVALVRESGALEACREEARGLIEDKWVRLSERVPPSEPKLLLRMLCTALLDRGCGNE